MAKYLQVYGTKVLLDAVQSSTTGQPWVGAETMTNSVRYEPKGIVELSNGEMIPEVPEIEEGEQIQQ